MSAPSAHSHRCIAFKHLSAKYEHHTRKAELYNSYAITMPFIILVWYAGFLPLWPDSIYAYAIIYNLLTIPGDVVTIVSLGRSTIWLTVVSLFLETVGLVVDAWSCYCLRDGPCGAILLVTLSLLFRLLFVYHQYRRVKVLTTYV